MKRMETDELKLIHEFIEKLIDIQYLFLQANLFDKYKQSLDRTIIIAQHVEKRCSYGQCDIKDEVFTMILIQIELFCTILNISNKEKIIEELTSVKIEATVLSFKKNVNPIDRQKTINIKNNMINLLKDIQENKKEQILEKNFHHVAKILKKSQKIIYLIKTRI